MLLAVLGVLLFVTASVGGVLVFSRPATGRTVSLSAATLVAATAVAFIVRLGTADPYFDDGRTYWEWGGSDPSHVITYVYLGVSAIVVGILVYAASRPAGTLRATRLTAWGVTSCALVAIVGIVATIAAFSGH